LETRLIDWDRVPGCSQIVERWGLHIALASVVDEYYQAVAEHHFLQLSEVIKEDLVVYEAGALMHVAVDKLLGSLFADRLGLFHWTGVSGHRSWALLGRQTVLHTNLLPMAVFSECVA
jgi:hypothetical protein